MKQLNLFDFVDDVRVPSVIYDCWQKNKEKYPTITSYTDALVENIQRWQEQHPERDFFEMWDDGRKESDWNKYMKSIIKK